ncbi:hypothetical protein AOZ06_27355 [Kibdelosporangium phytohabitans]|uniref:DUF2000 domain-containing protein n=1 Tax=Kibdelosporangium phytohabitans TaxID=860235 RepID=A0A0N9IJ42_9PSEU|nr:DUF2000 domain-containing protein [Kibdelosporangium phytohabitans]ALG15099.1 hypothetical protein AOZ06_27355 [Kibdelosporangium phytohabitans]
MAQDAVRVAIVVDPSLSPGLVGNTIATIAIGLGAAAPHLGGPRLVDRTGVTIHPSASVPVPVLQAEPSVLRGLLLRAVNGEEETVVVPFPAFARNMHDFNAYQSEFTRRELGEEEVHGVGLAGPRKWVASLTGSLKLLS